MTGGSPSLVPPCAQCGTEDGDRYQRDGELLCADCLCERSQKRREQRTRAEQVRAGRGWPRYRK